MKEAETAELFNKELDALLQDGRGHAFSPDPGAMALAGELARADFSGQSLIKESLRERLAGNEAGGLLEALRSLFSNNYARAAITAAVLVVAVLPLARRHAGRAPEITAPIAAARLLLPEEAAHERGPVSRLRAAPEPSRNARGGGLFASIPMARLETEPLKDFPITSAGSGSPVVLAEGREVELENGSGIVFETEGEVFTLERRIITPEDIFERRVI
ncbi:MAG: hypothetical protein Q7R35_10470 [Elusimicrobiota bacterium]|nr:hypothetical protein [Elusimicrobiota bacterium]